MRKPYLLVALLFATTRLCAQTWTELLPGNNPLSSNHQTLAMISSGSGRLFAGTVGGIYISDNNGITWTPSNAGISAGTANSFVTNGAFIFVAMNATEGVYRSNDDGKTWHKKNEGLPSPAIVQLAVNNGRLFGLVNTSELYYSNNDGDSWAKMTTLSAPVNSIVCSGTTLFAGSSDYGIYRSSDNGATWVLANTGFSTPRVIDVTASDGMLLAWCADGIYRSTNNGSTWQITTLQRGYPTLAQKGSTYLASISQGSVWRSVNSGTSWTRVTSFSDVCGPISVNNDFFVGNPDGIFKSTDDGMTWTMTGTGLSSLTPAVSADKNLFIASSGTSVSVSSNYGKTWTAFTVGTTPVSSVFSKKGKLYVSTRANSYSSSNEGINWSLEPVGGRITFSAIEETMFAFNLDAAYRTVVSGWTPLPNNFWWVKAITGKGNNIFSGSLYGGDSATGVFNSKNGGLSWEQKNSDMQVNCMAYDGSWLFAGTPTGLYKSADDGVTWLAAGFPGTNINAVVFNQGKLWVGHHELEVSDNLGQNWTTVTGEIGLGFSSSDQIHSLISFGTRLIVSTTLGSVWISTCVNPPNPTITGTWTHHPTILVSSSIANNEWFRNGEQLAADSGPTLNVSAAGTYTVRVNIDGCYSEFSPTYSITDCVFPPVPMIQVEGSNPTYTLVSSASEGNQWFLNGEPLPDSTAQTLHPKTDGVYTVKVTIDGCASEFSEPVSLIITGLSFNVNSRLTIYPNPAQDKILIQNAEVSVEPVFITISDLTGKAVFRTTHHTTEVFPISSLVPGIYVLQFVQRGKIFRGRFVKK